MSVHAHTKAACGTALVLAAFAWPALAGQRVAVEGAPISVEIPTGWSVQPMSTDSPQLSLTLCDPFVHDACLVRGEMQIEQLGPARAPASLESLLADARAEYGRAALADRLSPPGQLRVAGREAVETSTVGQTIYDYVGGGASTVKQGHLFITLKDGGTFYRCSTFSSPEKVVALRRDLIDFCSSLQFNGSSSQSGQQ